MKEAFERTLHMTGLLTQLLDVLSKLIESWEGFVSDNGDIGYFSDICSFSQSDNSQCSAHASLRTINNLCETLARYRRKLIALEKSCDKVAQDVS